MTITEYETDNPEIRQILWMCHKRHGHPQALAGKRQCSSLGLGNTRLHVGPRLEWMATHLPKVEHPRPDTASWRFVPLDKYVAMCDLFETKNHTEVEMYGIRGLAINITELGTFACKFMTLSTEAFQQMQLKDQTSTQALQETKLQASEAQEPAATMQKVEQQCDIGHEPHSGKRPRRSCAVETTGTRIGPTWPARSRS